MRKRVLIVDDDPGLLEICRLILESKNHEVFTAPDCNNIIELVTAILPSVIFIDNQLPGLCGADAIVLLKQWAVTKSIPVVLCTAHPDGKTLKQHSEADYFLQKPFNIAEIENIVEMI